MISSAKSNVQSIANEAKDAADNIGKQARDVAEDAASDARSIAHRAGKEARRVYGQAKDELCSASDSVGTQIRNNPVQSTLLALGAGLLLGAFLNRK